MNVRRWSKTWQRHGRFGGERRGSWAGRGWGCGCPYFSLKPSSNRYFYLAQRCGWLPPTWGGYWGVSKTMRRGNLRGRFHSGGCTKSGSISWRKRQERMQGLIQRKPAFGEGGMWLHIILRHNHLWTPARRRRGSRGNGWECSGGKRQDLTWQGKGRRQWRRRSWTRMGWKKRVVGLRRNKPRCGTTATDTKYQTYPNKDKV